jgi:hypothetical protein
MWPIIKSEMRYNMNASFGAIVFLLFMFLLYFFAGNDPVQVYVAMTALLIAPMIGGYAWDFRAKQRRDYFFSKLSVPIRRLAFVRLFYTVVLWAFTAVLYWTILLVFSLLRAAIVSGPVVFGWFHAPSAANFIWLTGWILTVNALYLIVTDKKADKPDGPLAFIYEGLKYVIPLAAMAPFYLAALIGELNHNAGVIQFFRIFFSSALSAGLVNVLGVGLSFVSIRVFSCRGSYTHS